jgi:hypothetical protein
MSAGFPLYLTRFIFIHFTWAGKECSLPVSFSQPILNFPQQTMVYDASIYNNLGPKC